MAQVILQFLQSITSIKQLIVAMVSMFPLIELKGAIPIGEGLGLPIYQSALIAYFGSTLIIIPVFFLMVPLFMLLKKIPFVGKFFSKLERMLQNRAEKVAKKNESSSEDANRRFLVRALLIFVAIPLPLTGVWTGAAIAVFLDMKFKDSLIPLALGNFIAGSLVTFLTYLFHDYVDTIILVMFIIALVMLAVGIIKIVTTKTKTDDVNNAENAETDKTDKNRR